MKTKIVVLIGLAICTMLLVSPALASDGGTLEIYGNANEDDTIDMRDLTYVKLIFFGKKPETELADAKYDGKINPLDFIQIKLIIVGNEKELTFVDTTGRDITVVYPLERIAILCAEVGAVIAALDAEAKVVGAVQRSYLLVLWVEVPPLQFSVGNVVIPDSRWSDSTAESSEVKAFYREASNQKGRSESERNRRRNTRYCSCQVSSAPRRWLLSLLEETEGCTQGSYRRTEGGNSGEKSRESSEGLRTSQDDPKMAKTVPITEEGNGKEVCRLADEVDKRRSQDDDKPGGARTSGFRRDSGYTSSRLSAGIGMLTQPKSQSVGQTCSFETDSLGSDEVCDRCTGKGSLRA